MKTTLAQSFIQGFAFRMTAITLLSLSFFSCSGETSDNLKEEFKNPMETSFPGVYWYFMDGNLSMEEMSSDLESMKDSGPGWCGSGGPWVKPEESMKHLVYSETKVRGNKTIDIELPLPEQRCTRWHRLKDPYYEDLTVYAIPGSIHPLIAGINEKALYERSPYSSAKNVKPYLPAPANYELADALPVLRQDDIIDITKYLQPGGNLVWEVPEGDWTIVRMGTRVTGANIRTVKFENGLMEGKEYSTGRYTFTPDLAMMSFNFTEPLVSGLLGPVKIVSMNEK